MVAADQNQPESVVEELTRDPHTAFRRMRQDGPVVRVPELDRWFVLDRRLAIDVLRDWRRFTVDDPRFTTARVVGRSMLSTDGDEHARHRHPFDSHFRRSGIQRDHTDWTAAVVRRLFDEVEDVGGGELRTAVAGPLAVLAISRLLGLDHAVDGDTELVATVMGWYRHIVAAVDELTAGGNPGGACATADTAMAELTEAVRIITGPVTPESSCPILPAVASTGRLSEPELVSNAAVIMFGAIETSEAMTANALWHLLEHGDQVPGWLDRWRAPELTTRVVEESLRMEPAAAFVDRYATTSTELAGTAIGSGDQLSVSLTAANRDPATFVHPDTFDPGRQNLDQQLAFVRGPHACIGLHLARLQTRLAVVELLDRWKRVQYRRDRSAGPDGLVFRKVGAVSVAIG